MQDEDDMNVLHFTILDNDLQQVQLLESQTLIGYYATLDAIIKVNKKRAAELKKQKQFVYSTNFFYICIVI